MKNKKLSTFIAVIISFIFFLYFFNEAPVTSLDSLENKLPELGSKIKPESILPKKETSNANENIGKIKDVELEKMDSAVPNTFPYGPPHVLYMKHIKNAENGDPESQYFVYLALRECDSTAKDYRELVYSMDHYPEYAFDMEKLFKKCETLSKILKQSQQYTDSNFEDLSIMWFNESKQNDYPLAHSYHINNLSNLEQKTRLQKSIKLDRYEGYMDVLRYYTNLQVDYVRADAWGAMACIANKTCSVERYLEDLPRTADPTKFREMENILKEIKFAVENNEWDKLKIFQN